MVRICGFFCGPRVHSEKGRVMAMPGWRTKRELTAKKRTTRKRTLMMGIKPKRAGWNLTVRESFMGRWKKELEAPGRRLP
jgi:hypothetical protein